MASRAGLHTVGRRILAMAAEPDPPRPRARLRLHRVDRAHYPCFDARGAAAGLYPHRPRQGSGPAQHPVRSCAEKRSRSDRDRDRYRRRALDRRRGGLVSGFVRWADGIIMRFIDGLMSIPPILLAVALMALTRGSVGNVILAITIAEIPRVTRLVRSVVLSLREQPYVDSAVASGTGTPMIILRHILPNTMAPMLVQATYICASAMIVESILSFIGAGTPPTIPSWGNIMAEGRALWQVKPYIVFFPAAFLSVTVLAVNLLGDGLRDALDPRMAKRL